MGDTPSVPQYQQPALDPSFARATAKSQAADVAAIQDRLKSDTASLTARFGQQPDTGGTGGAATTGTGPNANSSLEDIIRAGMQSGSPAAFQFLPLLSMSSLGGRPAL